MEAPPAEGGAEVARLVELLVDPRRLDLVRQGLQNRRRLVLSGQRLEGGLGGQHAGLHGIVAALDLRDVEEAGRSEEHTSELQSLMRISYAVFCLKKKKKKI